ncbi:phosphate signaling complex PhoU family protein [Methanolobus psychrotolerans]|uniref:phosphate signaling complex PhoU family protein n=1 Tax=Methanolobus psychrotolerans TaxID=1874706 RepID=UPI001F5DEF7D|nr:phosphate uptake regulator PhoU [Methanolobus psychrotolerans]
MTGGSTYIVSLPIEWVREGGLRAGDTVLLTVKPDRSLVITPDQGKQKKSVRSKVEMVVVEDQEENFRLLVANYLVGYDIIRIYSPGGFTAADRKYLKDSARKRLIGIEIVEESRNEIILQNLLNFQDISLEKSLQSMFRIIYSMMEDTIVALREADAELALDIVQRDNDVDKFYLLSVRQIKAALDDSTLAHKIGIMNNKDCLGYRLIIKLMERIGDHVQGIAHTVIQMNGNRDDNEDMIEMGALSLKLFNDSFKSVLDINADLANNVIRASRMSSTLGNKINRKSGNSENSYCLSGERQRKISESFQRIAEYSADIGEMVINMKATEIKDSLSGEAQILKQT